MRRSTLLLFAAAAVAAYLLSRPRRSRTAGDDPTAVLGGYRLGGYRERRGGPGIRGGEKMGAGADEFEPGDDLFGGFGPIADRLRGGRAM